MKNVAALSLTCAMLGLVGQSFDNPGMDSSHGLYLAGLPQQLESEPSNKPCLANLEISLLCEP
jgi:hypothetical protein